MKFEWDPRKARENVRNHGVSFEEAITVFSDWESITIPDPDHSVGEERWIILGISKRDNLLVVVHTERGEFVRIISAWHASARQRRQYEKTGR